MSLSDIEGKQSVKTEVVEEQSSKSIELSTGQPNESGEKVGEQLNSSEIVESLAGQPANCVSSAVKCGEKVEESQPDGASSSTTKCGEKRTTANSPLHFHTQPPSEKKRRVENPAVVIYNLQPDVDLKKFAAFVERTLEKETMRASEKVEIVECRRMPMHSTKTRLDVKVTFKTWKHSDLAISLSGVAYMHRALFATAFDPKPKKQETNRINSLCNECKKKSRPGAQSVLDSVLALKLYPDTVLHENRTRYISHFGGGYKAEWGTKRKCLRKQGLNDFLTGFHYRKDKQDAIIEFASAKTASMASQIFPNFRPWKPEYQSIFLDYFDKGVLTNIEVEEKEASMESVHQNNSAEMNFYHDTTICKGCAIYISGIKKVKSLHKGRTVLSWMQLKAPELCSTGIRVTRLHFRKEMEDAVVEFGSSEHAATAVSVLNGMVSNKRKLSVKPWNAEYQSMFVDHLENQKQAGIDKQREPNDTSHDTTGVDRDKVCLEKKPTQAHVEDEQVPENGATDGKEVNKSSAIMQDETEDLHHQRSASKQQNSTTGKNNAAVHDEDDNINLPETTIVSPENESGRTIVSSSSTDSKSAADGLLQTRLIAEAHAQIELLSSLLERSKKKLKVAEAQKQNLQIENESLQEELEQTRMNHAMEMGMVDL